MARQPGAYLDNYDAAVRELAGLEKKIRNKILRKGTRAGAKILQAEVKANVPVGLTGDLQKSIKVRTAKTANGKRLNPKFWVGHAVQTDVFYARFVEFGTKYTQADETFARAFLTKKPAILRKFKQVFMVGVAKIGRESKANSPKIA